MQAAIDAYRGKTTGLVLRYTGTFDFSAITDVCAQWQQPAGTIVEIKGDNATDKKQQNITIEGAPGSAANFGISIKKHSENIIIRNMTIGLLPGSIDAIGIEESSGGIPTKIWVDHNTLFSSTKDDCAGAGDLEFDGLIDIKGGANNITVSYNYIHDHQKVGLIGSSDTDVSSDLITYHHNYYSNVSSRLPLQRGGNTHLYNNLYDGIKTSGINVRMSGKALIESNYFENSHNPVTSRDSATAGSWQLLNNNIASPSDFSSYNITWGSCSGSYATDKCLKNASDWSSTTTFPAGLITYSYTPHSTACVKAGLPSVAGAGKNLATLNCN